MDAFVENGLLCVELDGRPDRELSLQALKALALGWIAQGDPHHLFICIDHVHGEGAQCGRRTALETAADPGRSCCT